MVTVKLDGERWVAGQAGNGSCREIKQKGVHRERQRQRKHGVKERGGTGT